VEDIRNIVNKFSEERNWNKTENPKNLAMALSVETAELLEIFQWIHSDDVNKIKEDRQKFLHLQEEIADVFWYLVRICKFYKIDLYSAVSRKAIKNAKKYPKEKYL
ncbi:MAG: nucleotide pyrophosphohydrolase, partial [Clostridiales bacterium]